MPPGDVEARLGAIHGYAEGDAVNWLCVDAVIVAVVALP